MFEKWKSFLGGPAEHQPFTLPLFPLNTVLFPGGVLPLKIFEQRYMEMAKTCLKEDGLFGVCLIREGSEVGAPAVPHRIGTVARIAQWDMPQLGVLQVRAIGVQRFEINDYAAEESGLLVAQAVRLPMEPPFRLPPEHAACAEVLKQIIAHVGSDKFEAPFDYQDGTWVGHRLAEVLPLKTSVKQNMLEMNDTLVRLDVLHKFLAQQGLSA